jgi:RNA polymerase sigma factor (sigma-70 family)
MMSIRAFLAQFASQGEAVLDQLYTVELRNYCVGTIRKRWSISVQETEDTLKDALIILVENTKKGSVQASDTDVRTYLVSVMQRILLQRNKRPFDTTDITSIEPIVDEDANILSTLIKQENLDALNKCIDQLNAKHQELIRLWMEKIPYAEVARLLNMTENSAKSTFHQLLIKLKNCIQKKR